jgi:hypothetical protein
VFKLVIDCTLLSPFFLYTMMNDSEVHTSMSECDAEVDFDIDSDNDQKRSVNKTKYSGAAKYKTKFCMEWTKVSNTYARLSEYLCYN